MSFFALISYIVVMSITPGPNNLLLASSGVNVGLRRTLPMSIGVSVGSGIQCFLALSSFSWLLLWIESIRVPLAILGCLYLLWLSWRIYQSSNIDNSNDGAGTMSFLQMALFQWVNPKAWLMALNIAILFGATSMSWHHSLLLAVFIALVNYPCVFVWMVLGDRLKRLLSQPQLLKRFNLVMALLMACTAAWLLVDELFAIYSV